MNFHIPDHIMRWLGPLILVNIFIWVVAFTPEARAVVCSGTENCLVSWVDALSGWAALAGALLTITVMRHQLTEQIRQTDYVTGDLDPEAFFDASMREEGGEYFSEAKITVINRNRRTLVLHRMEVSAPEGVTVGIRASKVDNDEKEQLLSEQVLHNYIHRNVPGKDDGATASRCVIECRVFYRKELATLSSDSERWADQPLTVKVFGWLKDTPDRPVEFMVSGVVPI
ncbi:hypothetical protein GOZ89_16155 [Agrobacterium vitis]|uniref:hypothetical protein n=1 Tax=Agrobacterium vitis TaxID=373 RepID=UPI0012E98058|nr:hypothetical protein [Agrobacterium vitis]MVA80959.1 hypothetical protein [Agrobacterium vitis]